MTKLLTKAQRAAIAATAKESGMEVSVEVDGVTLTFKPVGDDTYPDVETYESLTGRK